MSAQLFAGARKMGKLNGGDRQGMKRNHPGETQRLSCKQEIGSLPCPHPKFQRHRAEDLLRGARRKENQTLLGAELLKRGQRESQRQLESRNSHLCRLGLLSKASLSTDHGGYCCSREWGPGQDCLGCVWDILWDILCLGQSRSQRSAEVTEGPAHGSSSRSSHSSSALVSHFHPWLRLSCSVPHRHSLRIICVS